MIDGSVIGALVETICGHGSVRELKAESIGLDVNGMKAIGRSLAHNKGLVALDIARNELTDQHVLALWEGLRLELENTGYFGEGEFEQFLCLKWWEYFVLGR